MRSSRKDDHVRFAVEQHRSGPAANDFDAVALVHHALAATDCAEVELATEVLGRRWETPFFINGMTGGSEHTGTINRNLAIAARETGLPIGSGSMSAYFADEALADTFRVLRKEHPRGFVMANVNATATPDQVHRAIDLLEADALQIHLNALQEIVMPEGDREFRAWRDQVPRIAAAAGIPVIVKEVGFGLSRETVALLRDSGVAAADVGGRGGTNFARIENNRRTAADFGFIEDWGQSTVACLLDAAGLSGIEVLGSGGIRSPLDVAKALALGAGAVGVAGRFLHTLVDQGTDALITMITEWRTQLQQIMTVLGALKPADLTGCDLLITGAPAEFAELRGVDVTAYANRTRQANQERSLE
ncbi:type 2 isopentenyl-diphosphate Delta-isomerase [Nocardia colli]|uniref:Isopentenyl-diphosphate delta-isomerase n=1 Tax=Nocardia colli TaxID=2545717 RepID=A0A5N0EKD1_9NOCA|nr:type 2 isopentenyl-diphosphate Delta-isomerase [Nocardia colli]KAA8889453.1 type 2 isopentenyl-diphosphate Delta-isomerase [Nocardia colli]